jgi:cytochrome P450
VRDEVMTMVLAGHETTANALTWAFHELARQPRVRERLEAEVDEVLGGRLPTVADLPALPWTLAVLEETMRLHPPLWVTVRAANREVTLGGFTFAKDTIFTIHIRGIHRRPDYYPEPLAFRPERMLPAEKKLRPKHRYLPFGAGPRICIGAHFALLEAHLALATMAQVARLEPTSSAPVVPEPLLTLRPNGPMPMRVQRRHAGA